MRLNVKLLKNFKKLLLELKLLIRQQLKINYKNQNNFITIITDF